MTRNVRLRLVPLKTATGGAAVVCGTPHQFFSKGYDQPCIPSMGTFNTARSNQVSMTLIMLMILKFTPENHRMSSNYKRHLLAFVISFPRVMGWHSLRVFASILKYFVNFVNIPNISIQFNIFADAHAHSITRLNAKKFQLVQGRVSPSSALDGGVTQYMRPFDLVLMMVDDSSVLTGQSFAGSVWLNYRLAQRFCRLILIIG